MQFHGTQRLHRLISTVALWGAAWFALGASGCTGTIGLAPPGPVSSSDMAVADAAVSRPVDAAMDLVGADLAARDLAPQDLSISVDAAMSQDLTAIVDLSKADFTDLALPVDLSGPCKGGFLNAVDAATTCPLKCGGMIESVADEGATHEAFGTPISYRHNPPASGNHWPWPAPWGYHPEFVPQEWWVHNLEHGGIVLLYNCPYSTDGGMKAPGDAGTWGDMGQPLPDNCQAEIAKFVQLYATHPIDNFWDLYFEVRILITADPLLPTRFAAVAWDWTWSSNTLTQQDQMNLQCFMDARYGYGPEWAP